MGWAGQGDHAVLAQAREDAAHGFHGQAEMVGNVDARHGKRHLAVAAGLTFGRVEQEPRDALDRGAATKQELALEGEAGRLIVPRHPLWLLIPIAGGWPLMRLFARLDLTGGKAPGKRRRRRLGWRYVRLFTGLWAVVMCGLILFVGPSRWLAEHSAAWDFMRFPFYGIVVGSAVHYLFKHDIRHIIRRWRWMRRRAKKRLEEAKKKIAAAQQKAAPPPTSPPPAPPRGPRR